MARPADQHLTTQELETLVVSSAIRENEPAFSSQEDLSDAQSHVDICRSCRTLVAEHLATLKQLLALRSVSQVGRTEECPDGKIWLAIAAGTPGSDSERWLHHATACDHCGPLLRSAAEELSDVETGDEHRALASLGSQGPEWQGRLAARLAGFSQVEAKPRGQAVSWLHHIFQRARVQFVAATLILLLLAWSGFQFLRPKSVEQLLAQAYSERRPFDLRVPGAKHSRLLETRDQSSSSFDRSPSLLTAEAMIATQLKATPDAPRWLQAKARADLLDGHYSSSITSLQRALLGHPEDPSLLADLGTTLFQQAIADPDHHSDDLGKSFESLSGAISKSPNDALALFNRAVVAERAFLFVQAEEDWRHYLQVDSAGPWAAEAQERLSKLRDRDQKWKQARAEQLLPPRTVASIPKADSVLRNQVNQRIEEYLQTAVADWLPRSFPSEPQSHPDQDARAALNVLSDITLHEHRDPWLKDLFLGSDAKGFAPAIQDLALARRANGRGDYDEAAHKAVEAAQRFEQIANTPGLLRSNYEQLFALQFIRDGNKCAPVAPQALSRARQIGYTWLQAQLLLEQSACLNLKADLGLSRSKLAEALKICTSADYRESCLRVLTFAAAGDAAAGDMPGTWSLALRGLRIFWSGSYPELRGYSLYDPVITAAEAASQPFLQVAAWKQATALIDSDNDLLQRGLAHFYFAQAAMEIDDQKTFEREYKEYTRLFEGAPSGLAHQSDRTEIEIVTAKLEARLGKPELALERLQALFSEIQGTDNSYRNADFFAALGGVERQLGNLESAKQHLSMGVAIAERILSGLQTERERVEWEQKAFRVYGAFVESELQAGNSIEALEAWEWFLGAPIRKSIRSDSTVVENNSAQTPSDIHLDRLRFVRNQLPSLSRRTVISYALLADGLAIWEYDDRGVHSTFLRRDPKEIEALAKRFAQLCGDFSSELSTLRTNGAALYTLLVSPVESALQPDREIVIESDGALTAVPFEALVDSTGRYFGENRPLVSSLGLRYDTLLRSEPPVSPDDRAEIVGVAAPIGFSPLSGLDGELEIVANQFSHATILKDNDATLSAVLKTLPSATVFYFAGHAVSTPGRVGLVMADAEPKTHEANLLTAQNLNSKNTKFMKIAVLAGCNTDKGEFGSYYDVSSLARALIRLGVPMVVVSRWALSTGAPERLTLPFTFPQTPKHTDLHPYYWASLNQFGSAHVQDHRR